MLHEDRHPRVSIVMPYYNHGKFIDEALASIDKFADKNIYEVIIVNDGSTDAYSNERLEELAKTGLYKIVHQQNQGVCIARNNAISHARAEYILPVDSDNKIQIGFITEGMAVLDNSPEISVVYSDYMVFGVQNGLRKSGPYNLQRLMLDNFIENCSMFRKKIFDDLGGYDPYFNKIGIEDWEFWLKVAFAGHRFHYIEKPLFDYRISEMSRTIRLITDKTKGDVFSDYVIQKHKEYFGHQYVDEYFLNKFKPNFIGFMGKIVLRLYFPKMYQRLVDKKKLRKYL